MTNKDAMDYIRCALDAGCTQICNDKYRGQCTDGQISEAIETISKDLEELSRILTSSINTVDAKIKDREGAPRGKGQQDAPTSGERLKIDY